MNHLDKRFLGETGVKLPLLGFGSAPLGELFKKVEFPQAEEILNQSSGVVLDEIQTPFKTAGIDSTYVGRIRPDSVFENGVSLFLSGDNLRKGAALNAVQIAEALI